MEEHYVARLEFLCPRGFGMQVSLRLCMQSAGTYCPHFFLFPKINFTLWVLIKMKRSLALFSSKILTTVERMEHLPTRMKETRHTLGIGPKTFSFVFHIHFPAVVFWSLNASVEMLLWWVRKCVFSNESAQSYEQSRKLWERMKNLKMLN